MKEPDPNHTWLKQLQRESWQLELLISGFAIFLLLQAPNIADHFARHVHSFGFWLRFTILPLIVLFRDGSLVLAFCLVTHVALRGVWVALIGLYSTFPNGVRTKNLGFSNYYMEKWSRNPHDGKTMIQRLDDIGSSIFATSFLVVGNLVSFCSFYCCIVLASLILDTGTGWIKISGSFLFFSLLALAVLGLINTLTGGAFRRHERISRIYYPIDKLIGWVSLSFVYRPVYEVLATNTSKGRVLGLTLLILGVIVGLETRLNTITTAGERYYAYYDDSRPDNLFSPGYTIPTAIVTGDALPLFIAFDARTITDAQTNCPDATPDRWAGLKFFGNLLALGGREFQWLEQQKFFTCAAKQYELLLDGKPIETPAFHYDLRNENKMARHGFSAFIPLPDGVYGRMVLTVKRRTSSEESSRFAASIPFWRQKPVRP